ncbi:hypothetical protein D9M69_478930 [compost metagenome]
MAGVRLGRNAGALEDLPQQSYQAAGIQACLIQVAPPIQPAEHRSAGNPRRADPVEVGVYWAQPLQRGGVVVGAEVVPVALAPGQKQRHPGAGFGLDVLHLQAAQLIAAKAPPEANQQQCHIPPAAQVARQVAGLMRVRRFLFQPLNRLLQMLQLQRRGLLGLARVQGANTFQHLAHRGGLGGVGKALADVPLREGSEALLQRVEAQRVGVIHQVADDGVAGGRQEATPGHLEVLDSRLVAAPSVFPRTGLQVTLHILHR